MYTKNVFKICILREYFRAILCSYILMTKMALKMDEIVEGGWESKALMAMSLNMTFFKDVPNQAQCTGPYACSELFYLGNKIFDSMKVNF